MRILNVISYFYPAWAYGGPGKLVYELSNRLAETDTVSVYSTDAFDSVRRRKNSDNIFPKHPNLQIRYFRNISNTLAFKYKFFFSPGSINDISKKIRYFDLIHLHEFFSGLAVICSIFASKQRIPYVISAHGTLDSYHLKHRKGIKTLFMYLFGRKIIRNASAFIGATEEEIKEYRMLGIPEEKLIYIPNGISADKYMSLPQKGAFRKKYSIGRNTALIVYLGRIHKLKGLDLLLKAFLLLTKKHDSVLAIAGSNDGYLDEVKKMSESLDLTGRVIYTGTISGKDKLQLYADTDVFVYPSPSEGFSIAILEAAASGIPLVITRGCKFPDVREYNAGIITDININSLFGGLDRMLSDNKFRKEASFQAKMMIKKKYTIEIMALRLKEIYKQIVKKYAKL